MTALPAWNLKDLFDNPEDPKIQDLQKELTNRLQNFQNAYQGKVKDLNAQDFGKAISVYENIIEDSGLIAGYAVLLHAEKSDNPEVAQFYQSAYEFASNLSAGLVFFTLEINALDEKIIKDHIKGDEKVAFYAPWLEQTRLYKPYELSLELESFIQEKNASGHGAWVRLFDQTLAQMRFNINGKKDLAISDALHLLQDKDRDIRRDASLALADNLKKHDYQFGLILNTIAKDQAVEDQKRGYQHPISSRNLNNLVEDNVVDALRASVKEAYPRISHRYYNLKAKLLGFDKMEYWDRNAPYKEQSEALIPYAQAQDIVLKAYGEFSPLMADTVKLFFDKNWIDVPPKPGKYSGAFSHGMVPKTHPYILLNYHGSLRDVMTLAHELGHGVHQVLSAQQGALMCDTPLTLAETASVFGEMLTFRSLLKAQNTPIERRLMLGSKIEDMINTVVRQIAFCEFEVRFHEARLKGELTVQEISDLWMSVQKESLGPVFNFHESYHMFWAYISHFFHSPFYVYAYAFGDSLVNALYAHYLEKPDGFADKYIDLLKAGGTKRHYDLLKPFNLDARDPQFWNQGLSMISDLIDEFEATL